MPKTLEIDPNKGFIALPMSVFDLDLTPGAFRTLAELCRMANLDGQCWPSLKQLGLRLNRSRASISGYIAELRAASLIETETQKMANGYNYRLRYRVIFWKEWRQQMGQSTERRVQQVERPLKTKNHNHGNHSTATAGLPALISTWKRIVGKAPYPTFDEWPKQDLIERSAAAANHAPTVISVDILLMMTAFLEKKNVDAALLSQEAKTMLKREFSQGRAADPFFAALGKTWKSHWAQPPTASQLARLIRALPPEANEATHAKLLRSYLARWKTHSEALSLSVAAAKVAA